MSDRKFGRVNLYLSETLKSRAMIVADLEGVSLNAWIVRLIEDRVILAEGIAASRGERLPPIRVEDSPGE